MTRRRNEQQTTALPTHPAVVAAPGLLLLLLLIAAGVAAMGCRAREDGLRTVDGAAANPAPEGPSIDPEKPTPAPVAVTDAGAGPVDALAQPTSSDATPPPAACAPGETFCLGKIPQMCGVDGRWITGSECPYACEGGCVNRFMAVSAGRGSPTNNDGLAEFTRNGMAFFSKKGGLLGGARGFSVAVLDPKTGAALEPVRTFDPWDTVLSGNALKEMAEYLEALEPDRLVLMAICDDAGITKGDSCDKSPGAPTQKVIEVLQRMGSREIVNYCSRGAWSFATITGQGRALAEKVSSGAKVTSEVTLPALP
jgi:hypothetical protein